MRTSDNCNGWLLPLNIARATLIIQSFIILPRNLVKIIKNLRIIPKWRSRKISCWRRSSRILEWFHLRCLLIVIGQNLIFQGLLGHDTWKFLVGKGYRSCSIGIRSHEVLFVGKFVSICSQQPILYVHIYRWMLKAIFRLESNLTARILVVHFAHARLEALSLKIVGYRHYMRVLLSM